MSKKLSQAEVLDRFRKKHGQRYDYSEVIYVNSSQKVKIGCRVHKLFFEQSIHLHASGSGCPHCGIRRNARELYYDYKGVRYPSLKAVCESFALDRAVTQKRLQNGWTLSEAITRPHVPAAKAWKYKAVFYKSFGALYKAVNPTCSYNTFRRRLNSGMSIEEASTKIPSHGHANGLVYLITNNINGKKYIGITTESANVRFERHVAGASSKKHKNQLSLARAIVKYGADQFSIKTLKHASNVTELRKLEKYFIEKYQSVAPKGYNLSEGGSIGKPSGKPTRIDGKKFQSLKKAAEYLGNIKGISVSAAEKRISEGRIDVQTCGKKVALRAFNREFSSKAELVLAPV